jgi:hypothetical protein
MASTVCSFFARDATHWLAGATIVVMASVAVAAVDLTPGWALRQALAVGVPTLAGAVLLVVARRLGAHAPSPLAYLLFFAISITSLLGLTQSLTGSHAESTNMVLYGLSFYATSLAYLAATRRIASCPAFTLTNPLFLVTGPVLTTVGSLRHRGLGRRTRYYLPFVILGVFLHQTIATPMTQSFHLVARTDLASSPTFAMIFEVFVYANFCGLSLIVYGIAGVLGIRVPLNFKQPFSATHMIDFWRGWHVSLSTVLKALFHAPLRRDVGSAGAVLAVFLASAMWHGMTFNVLLWGLFHAAIFMLSARLLKTGGHPWLLSLLMVIGIVVGRLLFAESDSERLLTKLHFEFTDFGIVDDVAALSRRTQLSLALAAIFVGVERMSGHRRLFRKRNYRF